MILAICDTPPQTQCMWNDLFPHFIMVITVLWARVVVALVCSCVSELLFLREVAGCVGMVHILNWLKYDTITRISNICECVSLVFCSTLDIRDCLTAQPLLIMTRICDHLFVFGLCQHLIARNMSKLFSSKHGISHLYAACHSIDELIR